MSYDATYTVLKSPLIVFEKHADKDYNLVKAGSNIKKGTILLIEHTFKDKWDASTIKSMVRYNKTIFNSLHPREFEWTEEELVGKDLASDLQDLIFAKIQFNSFGDEIRDILIIGNDISRFNHSKTPNAKVLRQNIRLPPIVEGDGEFIINVYSSIIAIRDIGANEEIFIKYNDTITFEPNSEIVSDIPIEELGEIEDGANKLILKEIHKYIGSEKFADVMTVQYSIHNGLYLPNGIVIMTQKFNNFAKLNYKKAVTPDFIEFWLTTVHNAFSALSIDYSESGFQH